MTICDAHDVAWLVLDRPIELPAYPPIRTAPTAIGDKLTAYGWGKLSKDWPLTTALKQMPLAVLSSESTSYPLGGCVDATGDVSGAIGFGDVVVDGVQWPGDSGGPLFDERGELVSVHSHRGPSGECPSIGVSARINAYPSRAAAAFAEARAMQAQGTAPALPEPGSCAP